MSLISDWASTRRSSLEHRDVDILVTYEHLLDDCPMANTVPYLCITETGEYEPVFCQPLKKLDFCEWLKCSVADVEVMLDYYNNEHDIELESL